MCEASQVSASVSVADIPLSDAARALAATDGAGILETVLTGGDDYEILAAIPAGQAGDFEAASRAAGVPVARIGTVTPGAGGVTFRDADGSEMALRARGYEHFKG